MEDQYKQKILLIITGSIAACKVYDLVRLCKKEHIKVTCVLTEAAKNFVTSYALEAITNNKVYEDLFAHEESLMAHINLSRENDLILVAPATANIIAKMAAGLADDLASSILSAANKKVIMAPAMNPLMWDNKATQRNVSTLKGDGVIFLEVGEGILACGEVGEGRMMEPEDIVSYIKTHAE